MAEDDCAPSEPAGATGSKMGAGMRALAWFVLYLVFWLLMGLSCLADLPPDCGRPDSAVEVLIELPVLLAFAMAQVTCTKGTLQLRERRIDRCSQ